MIMKRILLLVPALFVTAFAATGAPIVHRKVLCQENGPCIGRSTNGGFEIETPFGFVDVESAREADAARVVTYTVGAMSDEGVEFQATCVARQRGTLTSDPIKDALDSYKSSPEVLKEVHELKRYGMPGVSIKFDSGKYQGTVRVYQSSCCAYTLVVQYPPAYAEYAEPRIDRFMNSFNVFACPKVVEECPPPVAGNLTREKNRDTFLSGARWFSLSFDPASWKIENPGTAQMDIYLKHASGEGYAGVTFSHVDENASKTACAGLVAAIRQGIAGREVAQERKRINGANFTSALMHSTVEGVPFAVSAHCWSERGGALVLMTWFPRASADKHQADLEELLRGLKILRRK